MPRHRFDADIFAELLEQEGARAADKYRREARRATMAFYHHAEDPSAEEDSAYRKASGLLSGRGQ